MNKWPCTLYVLVFIKCCRQSTTISLRADHVIIALLYNVHTNCKSSASTEATISGSFMNCTALLVMKSKAWIFRPFISETLPISDIWPPLVSNHGLPKQYKVQAKNKMSQMKWTQWIHLVRFGSFPWMSTTFWSKLVEPKVSYTLCRIIWWFSGTKNPIFIHATRSILYNYTVHKYRLVGIQIHTNKMRMEIRKTRLESLNYNCIPCDTRCKGLPCFYCFSICGISYQKESE